MLRKLLKHEFRATAMPVLLLAACMLAVSGIARLCMLLAEIWEFFAILSVLSSAVYTIGILAAFVFILVLIVRRFYLHIYGAEGYITLTLPAARWKIICSKLVVSLVWCAVGAAAGILSILILVSHPEFYREIGYVLTYIGEVFRQAILYLNMPAALLIAELAAASLASIIGTVLSLYAAVSIGQLFRKHRILGSAAGYMMIYTAEQLIMSGYLLVAGMTLNGIGSTGMYRPILDGMSSFQLQVLAILYILILILIDVGLYLITHTIMKKAVNLQ